MPNPKKDTDDKPEDNTGQKTYQRVQGEYYSSLTDYELFLRELPALVVGTEKERR